MNSTTRRHEAVSARSAGFVEVPGPLGSSVKEEIRKIAERIAVEASGDGVRTVEVFPFARGIAVKVDDADLARRIADAVARRLKADVIANCDPGAETCILTCHLPARGKKGA